MENKKVLKIGSKLEDVRFRTGAQALSYINKELDEGNKNVERQHSQIKYFV